MDEPLSNLDAKLRIELRDDIRDLQRSLGITTIYVTHDQEEALVISDRICIMQGGRVHQVARAAGGLQPSGDAVRRVVRRLDERVRAPSRRTRRRSHDRRRDARAAGAGGPCADHARDAAGGRRSCPDAGADAGDAIALDGAVDKVTYAGREAFYRLTGADGLQDPRARLPARSGPARRRRRAARAWRSRSRGCTRSIPPTAGASRLRAMSRRSRLDFWTLVMVAGVRRARRAAGLAAVVDLHRELHRQHDARAHARQLRAGPRPAVLPGGARSTASSSAWAACWARCCSACRWPRSRRAT